MLFAVRLNLLLGARRHMRIESTWELPALSANTNDSIKRQDKGRGWCAIEHEYESGKLMGWEVRDSKRREMDTLQMTGQ
jgi:hypothetical protein